MESSSNHRAQYTALNYRHKLTWHGGDDTASMTIVVTRKEAESIFKNYVGNIARVYVGNPVVPIFEGFINTVVYEVGNMVFRRSLDNMFNRVEVTYWNTDSGLANKTETTAQTNNATSQAIYGVKGGNVDAGVHFDNANKTHKTILRDTIRSVMSYPDISVASRAGGDVLLSLELKGLHHIWDWETYTRGSNATDTAGAVLWNVTVGSLYSVNAPSLFEIIGVAGYDALVSSNAGFSISYNSLTGQSYLQFIKSIVEAGDGVNEWVFGITRYDVNRASATKRQVYYRAANTAIKYYSRALGKPGEIYDISGRVYPPWLVRPDNGIQVVDVLANFQNEVGDDPRKSYIKFIEYDAESQMVSWQSSDDATLEGALGVRKYFKTHGKRFGAEKRPLY